MVPPMNVESETRPNFIILLADDLGYGDLSGFGHPTIRTPNLDRLANQGLKLTSCYAGAPVCSPSRAALMTGRVPQREGIAEWIPDNSAVHLRRGSPTIASLLRDAGYATAMFGKWHLSGRLDGSQPTPGEDTTIFTAFWTEAISRSIRRSKSTGETSNFRGRCRTC